jgi:hypothetical protein
MDLNSEGAVFTVMCKRCQEKFEVTRNWGGGIRTYTENPAKCKCGSRQLELF